MPVNKRNDGLYDVTDEYGGVALEGVPADYLPADIRDPWAPEPAPVAAPKEQIVDPWAEPGPAGSSELYHRPDMPIPPSLQSQGIAGPGEGESMSPMTPAEYPAQDVMTTAPDYSPQAVQQLTAGPKVMGSIHTAESAGAAGGGMGVDPGDTGTGGPSNAGVDATKVAAVQQAAMGRAIPAAKPGWYPSTTSIERTAPLPEEVMSEFGAASKGQQQAAQSLGAAKAATQSEVALSHARRQEAANSQILELQRRKDEERDILDRRMKVVSMKQAELRDARKAFDPDKYWNDKGAFGTVLAKIGVALSDFGSAVLGQKNPVREQIQQEIDRSIAVQERQLDYLGDDLGAEYTILGEMRKNFADKDSADLATRALLQEAAAAHIDEIASMGGSMETMQAAKAQAADLRMQAAQNLMEVYQKQQGIVHEQAVYSRGSGGGRVGGGIEPALKLGEQLDMTPDQVVSALRYGHMGNGPGGQKLNEAQRKQREDEVGRGVMLPDGSVAYARTRDYADKARSVVEGYRTLNDNFARQLELMRKFGGRLSPEAKGEYATLVQRNIALFKDVEGLGAITASDQSLVDPLSGRGGVDADVSKMENWETYVKSAIQGARNHVEQRLYGKFRELYKDPWARQPIMPGPQIGSPAESGR